jgi:hypothetical protein
MSDMLDFFERYKVLPKDIPEPFAEVEKRLLKGDHGSDSHHEGCGEDTD